MAEHDDDTMDMAEHRNTYDLFLSLTKWSVILIAITLVLMAFFLV